MSAFAYIAINPQGQKKKGVMEGDTARQVRQQLRQQNLVPLEINPVTSTSLTAKFSGKQSQRMNVADLALLTRQLATLMGASMPLEEALSVIVEQLEKPHLKNMMMAVRAKVMEGRSLAVALEHFPRAFSSLYCATVAAGEQTGHLEVVLSRLADYIEQQQQMRQKINHALIYPSVMLVVAISIVGFLMVYVVPKIVGIFSNTGQPLPVMTSVLIAISDGVRSYGVYFLIVMVIAMLGFRHLLKQPHFRYQWHSFKLRLPLIRHMQKVVNTSRFSRTLGILTSAGVPLLEAMRVSSDVISNLPIQAAVAEAALRVREGVSIHRALQQTKYFPPMSIHLIASGEASGQLAAMLERTADNQDREITHLIDTGLALFEPALILIMGSVVLFIVLAILLPIFSLDQLVG